jgi:hypothetical protein
MSNTNGTSSGNQGNQKSDKNAPGNGSKDNQGTKAGTPDGGKKQVGSNDDAGKLGQNQQASKQDKSDAKRSG